MSLVRWVALGTISALALEGQLAHALAADPQENQTYPTPEAALEHIPAIDPKCLDEKGENGCTAFLFLIENPADQRWVARWRPSYWPSECIDRHTAELAGCDAPEAVRTLAPPPQLCRRNADGSSACPPRRAWGFKLSDVDNTID